MAAPTTSLPEVVGGELNWDYRYGGVWFRPTAGYWTTRDVYTMREPLRDAVVLGGGPVGLETAQMLNRLGTRVTIVEEHDRLLAREDPAVGARLQRRFEAEGIQVLVEASAAKVTKAADRRIVHLDDGSVVVPRRRRRLGRRRCHDRDVVHTCRALPRRNRGRQYPRPAPRRRLPRDSPRRLHRSRGGRRRAHTPAGRSARTRRRGRNSRPRKARANGNVRRRLSRRDDRPGRPRTWRHGGRMGRRATRVRDRLLRGLWAVNFRGDDVRVPGFPDDSDAVFRRVPVRSRYVTELQTHEFLVPI